MPQAKFLVKFVAKNYKRYLFSKYVACNQESDGVRYIYEIRILFKTYSQKLGYIRIKFVAVVCTLGCIVPGIYKQKD